MTVKQLDYKVADLSLATFGRKEIEAAWRNAEVDCLYRLFEAGVRVATCMRWPGRIKPGTT